MSTRGGSSTAGRPHVTASGECPTDRSNVAMQVIADVPRHQSSVGPVEPASSPPQDAKVFRSCDFWVAGASEML
jgi:hypothetical protein